MDSFSRIGLADDITFGLYYLTITNVGLYAFRAARRRTQKTVFWRGKDCRGTSSRSRELRNLQTLATPQ